jgi:hypothetical protein
LHCETPIQSMQSSSDPQQKDVQSLVLASAVTSNSAAGGFCQALAP